MSTKPLRFQGYSDDTFGEYGRTSEDHDNCANGRPIVFEVKTPDGAGLHVWGQYAGKDWPREAPGCWMIGVQQLGEDVALPGWPMRWSVAESGYSPALEIEAPADATLRYLPAA